MKPAAAQLNLFADVDSQQVRTEGIKYIGSKLRLLPYIVDIAKRAKVRSVFDAFSGSTRVSQAFAQIGCDVITSDISVWSEVFSTCYLLASEHGRTAELIKELNDLKPVDGWFTENYGGDAFDPLGDGYKKPWQRHNTRKLDAIREAIDIMALTSYERATAIASLILALDSVDSTLGHFASYLKEWSPRSYKPLMLEMPNYVPTKGEHAVRRGDVFQVIDDIPEVDLAYLDPPYGSSNEKMPPSRVRYAAYYHIWTTVCLNDKPPLFGKARRRADSRDTVSASVFEDFRRCPGGRFRVIEALEKLIDRVRAKYVLLSYSSGGRATSRELIEVLQHAGKIEEIHEIEHKRNVMSGMRWTNEWIKPREGRNLEYLYLLKKH